MSGSAEAIARPPYLAFLPRFLFETDRVKARYIGKAWLVALLPSIALSLLAGQAAPGAAQPDISVATPLLLFLLVLGGPFAETLIMGGLLLGLDRLFGPGPAAIVSAILWGIAHSLLVPIWGLIIWWPFLILSVAFLTWRPRGLWVGIAMATAIHGLQNSVAAVGLLMAG
jgi:membrane protease YdiL (CAAX protease family)